MKIFSHQLTKTDVNNRLSVPKHALPYLPRFEDDQRAQDLIVEDENREEWVFRFRIREGRHKKPEFFGDWLDFVRSKELRIGDWIHFFREEDEATGFTRYKIKAMTEIILLGKVVTVIAESNSNYFHGFIYGDVFLVLLLALAITICYIVDVVFLVVLLLFLFISLS